MKLSAVQSIKLFGFWDQPREYATWDDIKHKQLSWRALRVEHGFAPEELHSLQPDKEEWIKRGQLTLADVADMRCFPVHPFRDLRADLGEVWNMRWPPELLQAMGVTFHELREQGMTEAIMAHFGFPLSAWQKLGLRADDVTPGTAAVFGLGVAEVRTILADHPGVARTVHKVRP